MKINRFNFEYNLLYILFFLVFLRASDVGFGYPNIEELLGFADYSLQKISQFLILVLLLVYAFFYSERFKILRPTRFAYVILFFSVLVSIILSEEFILSFRFFLSFSVIILPIILFNFFFGYGRLIDSLYFFISGTLVLSFIYILFFPNYGIMAGNHDGSFRGLFLHKNVFGIFCVLSAIFFINEIFVRKKFSSVFSLLMLFICFVGVFKSKSTTSLILFFTLLLMFVFFKSLNLFKENLRVPLYYFFVFLIVFLLLYFSIYFEEITLALGKDPTLTGRTELWEVIIYYGFEEPFFGHGFGLFFRPEIVHEFSSEFGWDAKSLHNSFLDLFLGIGLFGLVSFLYIIMACILKYPFLSKCNKFSIFSITGILVVFCYGLSESGAFLSNGLVWLLFVVFILGLDHDSHI